MVDESEKQNLIRKVDCIRIPVTNLESGLRFYRDSLSHELIWRIETSVGLRIPESKPELVIHTEPDEFWGRSTTTNRSITISAQKTALRRGFFKEIDLPAAINQDIAEVRYTNGILEVRLKKLKKKENLLI